MKQFAIAAAILLAAAPAHAEKPKSRVVAQALAGIGTAASTSVVLASMFFFEGFNQVANPPMLLTGLATSIVTPSLGQFYAHDFLTIGMATRLISGAAIAVGAFALTSSKPCLQNGVTEMCSGLTQQGIVVIGLGAIGYIGGVAYDINDTGDAVDRYNQKLGIFVAPSVGMARGVGDRAIPTVGIGGSF